MTPPHKTRWRFYVTVLTAGVFLTSLAEAVWWLTPVLPRVTLPKATWILGLSPDGRHLVTHLNGRVTLWDVTTGRAAAELTGNLSGFREFTFSPDGHWLTASDGSLLKLWEMPGGRERVSVASGAPWSDRNALAHPTFSSDGKWLAFRAGVRAEQFQVKVWNLEAGREQNTMDGPRVENLYFSPDGKTLAFESWEPRQGQPDPNRPPVGRIRLWDAATGRETSWPEGEPRPLRVLVFSPDGRTLATGERPRWRWEGPYEIRLWDLATGTSRGPWLMPRSVAGLHFIDSGTKLLAEIRLDDTPKIGAWRHYLLDLNAAPPEGVTATPFVTVASADGRLLACIPRRPFPGPPRAFEGEAVAGAPPELTERPPAVLELPSLRERSRLNPSPARSLLAALDLGRQSAPRRRRGTGLIQSRPPHQPGAGLDLPATPPRRMAPELYPSGSQIACL
jgi:hypothetical protein